MPSANPRTLVSVTYTYQAKSGRGRVHARLTQGPLELGRMEIPFTYRVRPSAGGREVSYAAATALAERLAALGLRRVELLGPDGELPEDVVTRRPLPEPLTIPYVTLGCALNRFLECRLGNADPRVLAAVQQTARYPRSA